MRSVSGKQEMDIFCPVRVSGWINNIRHIVVADTNIDHRGNRDLSFFMDCGYSVKSSSMDVVPCFGATGQALMGQGRGQVR